MNYEERRDKYLDHVRSCIYCGYSLTQLKDRCNVPWCKDYGERIKYHTLSHMCSIAKALVEVII